MEVENKTVVEDLTCRYYVGDDRYVLMCISESGIKVVDEVGIFENQAWRWTHIGDPEVTLNELIPTWEFKGKLIRRAVDKFLITDAVIGNRRIVRVDWADGFIVVRGRAQDINIGEDLAWHLARHMPACRALDIAAKIVDPDNEEEVRRQLRERLTRIDVQWPEPPIGIKFGKEIVYHKMEVGEAFSVRRERDGALVVRVPASCRKDIVVLEGGRFGIVVRCVANKPSKSPSRNVVAVKDGIYLTAEALYFSAYLEEEKLAYRLQCLEVGDRCVSFVRDVAEKNGTMVIDSIASYVDIDIIEGRGYKAYVINIYPKLFYVDASEEVVRFTERDIENLDALLKDLQKSEARKAVESVLRHLGYPILGAHKVFITA